MSVGVTEEHRALAASVRGWADRVGTRAAARTALDDDADQLPGFWTSLAEQEWLGLAIGEEFGGGGYGVETLAVVIEELGRAATPGPFVTTTLAALLIERYAEPALAKELLPRIAAGELTAGVAIAGGSDVVIAGGHVDLVVVERGGEWYVLDATSAKRSSGKGMDATRRAARVEAGDTPAERRLTGLTDDTVRLLGAAFLSIEAAGIAGWCLDTAVAYAKVREQFGRTIGGFQSIKHKLADLLCAVELGRASSWDAARAVDDGNALEIAVAVAVATAVDGAVETAKGCVQVLGGIGYTWEHDAHIYLKRALATKQLLGGVGRWRRQAAVLAQNGMRRPTAVELPPEAEEFRGGVQAFLESIKDVTEDWARRVAIADAGYMVPHWPKPYGLDAGALEQLVIEEEFRKAKVRVPGLVIAGWALPPIIQYGTEAQRERFVRPALYGQTVWCQMFSEPGAGSDLAALKTAATRVDGGWVLNGQKVWTSLARVADWAICLARTNPDAPKHEGITYFLLDMKTPGLDIRPLRELTGEAMFNEIFLTDVFVPDDCVVGEVDGGWKLARTTLANERVAMSTGAGYGAEFGPVLAAVSSDDEATMEHVGALLCHGRAETLLGLRQTLAAVSGTDPGSASSVRKLVGMHHRQEFSELALEILGPDAVSLPDTDADNAFRLVLATRALTIAGGTSEVLHNVIGERILGLPRD